MRRMVALFFVLFLETVSASPFRVLVFPHRGTYPVPQGREAIVSKVKITSEEVCNQYIGQMNADHVWEKTGEIIDTQKSFTLSSAAIQKEMKKLANPTHAYFFECTQPFTIHRDAKLSAYSYSGNFVALVDPVKANKMIQIINLVDSEKYIQGVVPSEVGSGWPEESLKAQAVAARTFAWWTVLNEKAGNDGSFDLNDTVEYQAYLGTTNQTDASDQAVTDTANQVMRYHGKVIKAYFSADSGGKTESAKNAFGQSLPYCVSKEEEYDSSKVKSSWEMKLTYEEIGSALGKKVLAVEVDPTDVNESGRVENVTVTTEDGEKIKVSGPAFRLALKLRSTLFEMKTIAENDEETVQISGKGFGHGVGMAQVGAKQYALQLGWNFEQILKFYYTGITLEPVTNEYTE